MNRKVLFIAYNFPPAGGAGVQRSLKFVKYLKEFGWMPVVITATLDAYPVLDESMKEDVPLDIPVYRIKGYDIKGLRGFFTRIKLGKIHSILNTAMRIPDTARIWAHIARASVSRAVEKYKPSLIYSSSAPESAHILGGWTKCAFNLPWVADFRDPWSKNRLFPNLPVYTFLNRYMERRCLQSADTIVTVSEPLANEFKILAKNPRLPVKVVENGFDEDDVVQVKPKRTERFTITYTGSFTKLRRPDAFVSAVKHLVDSHRIAIENIRVVIAGHNSEKYIPNKPPFEQTGYLSCRALSALRQQSDLFLLIQDDSLENRGAYSGKLFEYLGSNRPTLAITRADNVAARLIRRSKAGTIVGHNPDEISSSVLEYYHNWENAKFNFNPDWSVIRKFTRRNLTGRLAKEFDRLVS